MPFYMVNDDITQKNADIKVRIRNADMLGSVSFQQTYTLDFIAGNYYSESDVIRINIEKGSPEQNFADNEIEALCAGYQYILLKAADYGYASIELPLLWTPGSALSIACVVELAKNTILEFLDYYDFNIYLIVPFYQSIFVKDTLLHDISTHVNDKFINSKPLFPKVPAAMNGGQKMIQKMLEADPSAGVSKLKKLDSLDELMNKIEDPFTVHLFRLIDERQMSDVEVYKGALLDRKLFSKIRKGNGYTPRKDTIIALAISLKLNLDETQDLLKSAGYILSDSSKFDLIIGYFIEHEEYDIFKINETLYKFGLPSLGHYKDG